MSHTSYAFLSGTKATWKKTRSLGVVKVCYGVVIKGLSNALLKDVDKIIIQISGKPIDGWTCVNDRIIFKEPIAKGNYYVHVHITYNFLESTEYGYY